MLGYSIISQDRLSPNTIKYTVLLRNSEGQVEQQELVGSGISVITAATRNFERDTVRRRRQQQQEAQRQALEAVQQPVFTSVDYT